ncbi:hypothetical protein K1T71_003496 [Dendrolimus kikuchii]|uniref:Uncharacterized protein n=1 Tax=Dendrolimus kikuchii TaxID=765133 RepID=A0ACC1DCM3_9NEOP|nr:hypothetical protein K1T71_003496 [Dendrolimus kikuchii]
MKFELVVTLILYNLFFTNGLDYKLKNLLRMIQRRNFGHRGSPILGTPRDPEDLPEAEPILPGHSLLRPSMTMLKSAVKFPHRDVGTSAVYGNVDNIGITYGKTNERILYSDFRKSNNNLLAAILQVIRNSRDLRKPMVSAMIN